MRFLGFRFAWSAIIATMVGAALAQTSPSRPLPEPKLGNQLQPRPLIMERAIQKEIGLSDKQVGRISQIENSALEQNQAAINDPGEDGFDFTTMMGDVEQTARQKQVALAKVLNPAQRARLQQIDLQREGWPALARSDVSRKIKLAPAQAQKIQALVGKMRQAQLDSMMAHPSQAGLTPGSPAMNNLNPGNGFMDPTGEFTPGADMLADTAQVTSSRSRKSIEAAGKIRTVTAKDVEAILTPDQKVAFEQLLGAPFDFGVLNRPAEEAKPDASPQPSPSRKSAPKRTTKK